MSGRLPTFDAGQIPPRNSVWEALLQVCQEPAAVMNGERVVAGNSGLQEMLKCPDVVGQTLAAAFATNEYDRIRPLLTGEQPVTEEAEQLQCRLAGPSGNAASAFVSIRPCPDQQPPVAVVCFHRDPDRDPPSVDRAAPAAESHVRQEFNEIAAALVHELGQPVTVIHGACELLYEAMQDADVSEIARRATRLITESGAELSAQLRSVWDFIHNGQPRLELGSLNEIVVDAVAVYRTASGQFEDGIQMTLDDAIPDVLLDPVLIRLVLVKLLTRCRQVPQRPMDHKRDLRVTTIRGATGVDLIIEPDVPDGLPHTAGPVSAAAAGRPSDGPRLHVSQAILELHQAGLRTTTLPAGRGNRYQIWFPVPTAAD